MLFARACTILLIVIEEQLLSDPRSSGLYTVMTNESMGIAVLMELVLVGWDLTDTGVKTCFYMSTIS